MLSLERGNALGERAGTPEMRREVYEGMGDRRDAPGALWSSGMHRYTSIRCCSVSARGCEKGTMHNDMLNGLEGCTALAGNASSLLEALIDGANQHQYVLMIITSHIVSGTLRDTRISSLLCIYSC